MRQANLDGARARYSLLQACIEGSQDAPPQLIASLSNQRAFAALELKGRFDAITLNTLKSAARIALANETPDTDGWDLMDSLREQLWGRSKERQSRRSFAARKTRDTTELRNLAERTRLAELASANRSRAYVDLFGKISGILKDRALDDRIRLRLRNLLADHDVLFRSLMHPTGLTASSFRMLNGGKK